MLRVCNARKGVWHATSMRGNDKLHSVDLNTTQEQLTVTRLAISVSHLDENELHIHFGLAVNVRFVHDIGSDQH